jgi:hypothetical protein
MAKRRTRRSSRRQNATNVRTDGGGITGALAAAIASSKVPQLLDGAVTGLESVAVGTLQLARNVLVTAVSGAAEIGTEAVTATVSGARGVVGAASRMVGDIAATAQTTLQEAWNPRWSGNVARHPLAGSMESGAGAVPATSPAVEEAGPRQRKARARATRQPRASVAA